LITTVITGSATRCENIMKCAADEKAERKYEKGKAEEKKFWFSHE
jgi:hypothetical protein